MVSYTHIPSSIINLVLSLSLSLSMSCNHTQTTKSNMSSSLSNNEASSGVLDPCHRLASLAMHQRHAEQGSEPGIIKSSTRDIGRVVCARAIWVEFRRAESNNAKLKTRNDSGATALETEQKVSNVIGKSRSETTPPKEEHPSRQKAMSWSDQSEEGRNREDTETEHTHTYALSLSLRRTKRLRSDSCTHCSLSPRFLLLVLLLIQQEHHQHQQQQEDEEERPSRYLREAPLSHPLSLILSYNNIWEREWESERERAIDKSRVGRKKGLHCIVSCLSLSLSMKEKEKEKKDTRLERKQTTNREYSFVGGWRLAAAAAAVTTTASSSITTTSPTVLGSLVREVKKVFQCKVETSSQALALFSSRREESWALHRQCSVSLVDLLLNTQHWEREREKNKWNRSNPQ